MTNWKLLGATALRTGAIMVAASAAPAIAATAAKSTGADASAAQPQTTNSTQPSTVVAVTQANNPPTSKAEANAITVTGSRIRTPNLQSALPVTSVQGEQFFERGSTDIGDALNDLPSLRNTFNQQNPGLGIGIAGLNLLDLRGLAPKRTLVLVNGRRHVGSDILSSASVPDVNTISADLVDRVDIVTGGNSAVYGSDAIAGVVNFVLKRDFSGLQLRAQGSEAAAGFGTDVFASAMWGRNFNDGKGNITLQGEYAHDQRVFASDIPWLRTNNGFVVSDVDTGLAPSQHGSDGFPDRVFVHDIRSTSISPNGLVPITQAGSVFGLAGTGGVATCGTGLGGTNGGPSTIGNVPANNGSPFNCNFIFNPDGSLVAETGSRVGQGPTGNFLGGNGPTGREGQTLSVFPENRRINLNLLAHYTVSDAFEPFVEAKFVQLNSTGNNAGPTFDQGTNTFDYRERTRLDNPFLTAAERTTIASAILASGCNTNLTLVCAVVGNGSPTGSATKGPSGSFARGTTNADPTNGQGTSGPLNATDVADINAGTYRFVIARNLLDAGLRDENFNRKTYRAVAGVRGTFNSDWNYEVSANYGEFDQTTHTSGFLDRQRFVLSMDAGRNPVTGQIQCRSQFDATAARAYNNPASSAVAALQNAKLAADIAACVPYNPFGDGANNAAAVSFFTTNEHKSAKMTQLDFMGFMNGNLGKWFELPGGAINFVLGAEYRKETARYTEDPFVNAAGGGLTNDVDVGNFNPKPFHVGEAFGEVRIPIAKDLPFLNDLSLSGAARYSRYKSPINGVFTYNFGGEWAPVRDIRFRGNFGRAVRAPNLSETGFPVVPNFSPTFQDPCSVNQISNNPTRTAACQTQLGALLPNIRNGAYSLGILSGSNPNLLPEVSYSLTLGGVLQPRFIPGFSVSVDYYNIKVKGVIAAISAQTIVNNCVDLAAGNAFCGLFQRQPAGSTGTNGETPGNVVFNSVLQAPLNFASRIARGIDTNASYRAHLAPNITLDANVIWTHLLKRSNFQLATNPNFETQILGELGDPKDEAVFNASLKVGHVTFGYKLHYIGPMFINLAEDQISLPTACTTPGNPDTCPPNNADFATPNMFPAITYHGLRLQWDTGPFFRAKNLSIYAGVDNIFDRHAPFGLTATGSGPGGVGSGAIYDVYGRRLYGGIKANF
jgi:outer membrane receptor protein involved in Fe transport